MNYIDVIFLIFLGYGAFKGFSHGLIIEVATLVGLVLGVFIAIKFSGYTESILRDFMDISSKYLAYIALSVTFLVVAIGVYLLGKLLTGMVDVLSLGLVNKLLGTVLGIGKYFVILCVLLLIIDATDDKFHFIGQETKDKSLLFNPFLNFARGIYNMIRF